MSRMAELIDAIEAYAIETYLIENRRKLALQLMKAEKNQIPLGVYEIPVTDLKVGMTVYKWVNNRLIPDYLLREYFPTSEKFPTLSFITASDQRVIWRPCGKVWVKDNGKGM